jgi:hypothetical protein
VLFKPNKNKCPYSLRAGIATPNTTKVRGKKKQTKSCNNKYPRKQGLILREKGHIENVVLLLLNIKQNSLMAILV